MATLSFFIPAQTEIQVQALAGSGLGFYGADGFASPVLVGEYADSTWVTDGNGVIKGPQTNNFKYLNAASGFLNGSTSGIPLISVPNYQSVLNIRFEHSLAVRTQNAELRIYDRTNIDNPASGVTIKCAEIKKPSTTQTPDGSGSTTWAGTTINPQTGTATVGGSGLTLSLTNSPGTSGLSPNGDGTTDVRHDYFVVLSAGPDTIGSKTQFGLYASLEYL